MPGVLLNHGNVDHGKIKNETVCYFGERVATASRSIVDKFSLKKRTWIGPTSTCAELAFLMANMGQVTSQSMVLDPFVGTGSLLVSAGHFNAYCIGTDSTCVYMRTRLDLVLCFVS